MTGNAEMPGLTPRAVTELYSTIGDMTDSTVVVKSYFVELYNDQVVDLYAKLAHQKEVRPIGLGAELGWFLWEHI